MKKPLLVKSIFVFLLLVSTLEAQTGGDFTITQSVIAAGGGQNPTGGGFSVDDTIGQTLAGTPVSNGNFSVASGFWTAGSLSPTAAAVRVGGRVMTAEGSGIRNAVVTMIDENGQQRGTLTGKFGAFKFDDVAAGETYIFIVSARRFTFSQPTQVVSVLEETGEINFIADSQPNIYLGLFRGLFPFTD